MCLKYSYMQTKGEALPTIIAEEDLPDISCEFCVTKIQKIQCKLTSDDQQLDSEVDTTEAIQEMNYLLSTQQQTRR